DAHWQRLIGKRPARHQARQTLNATHSYTRRAEVDWLIHMDVDEFLVAQRPIADVLADLPRDAIAARARPMELLGGSADAFKAFIPAGPDRQRTVTGLYPNFGRHLTGGFVSHVAGKVFVRSGLPDLSLQIHDALQRDTRLPSVELPEVDLAHCHAASWDAWRARYAFRLRHGSYRAEIKRAKGGLSIHELLSTIEAEEGENGLRGFYGEVLGDSPDLRARLDARGLLRLHDLRLDEHASRHFPDQAI
ncbi:MAG: glycosyltransferase family 2 protein, partial [Pseudomonadota bacterium]